MITSELALQTVVMVVSIAFVAELVDSSLGMGYGTTLTPVLLLLGFAPLQVVPAILLSELITGFAAGFTHHRAGNVDFRPRTMRVSAIIRAIRTHGVAESLRRGLPLHLRITLLIGACSVVGTVVSVVIALNLPKFYLKLYIGVLVLIIGIVVIATRRLAPRFSWKRIAVLGIVASFNKGISGGGYGPVVTGGQILAGVDGKNAVGITSLAEGLTCLVGVIAYFAAPQTVDWSLAPWLCGGALLSVPVTALIVRQMKTDFLQMAIGAATIVLGTWTVYNTVF